MAAGVVWALFEPAPGSILIIPFHNDQPLDFLSFFVLTKSTGVTLGAAIGSLRGVANSESLCVRSNASPVAELLGFFLGEDFTKPLVTPESERRLPTPITLSGDPSLPGIGIGSELLL